MSAIAIAFIVGFILGGWFVKYTMDKMNKERDDIPEDPYL